jgi:hypothetical protein
LKAANASGLFPVGGSEEMLRGHLKKVSSMIDPQALGKLPPALRAVASCQ